MKLFLGEDQQKSLRKNDIMISLSANLFNTMSEETTTPEGEGEETSAEEKEEGAEGEDKAGE